MAVTVRFIDMGAAAGLGAIYVHRDDTELILVHTGLSDEDAYEAVAALCENPPKFPWFTEARQAGSLAV